MEEQKKKGEIRIW